VSTWRLCSMQVTWRSWGHQEGFVWANGLSRDDYYSLVEVRCPSVSGYRPTPQLRTRLTDTPQRIPLCTCL
jgi:hypothetical protein